MASPRRNSSGSHTIRRRIPKDVQDEYKGLYGQAYEAKFTVRAGTEAGEARRLMAEFQAEHEARVKSIRDARAGGGATITFQQAHTIAADWYRWFVGKYESSPTTTPDGVASWEVLRDEIREELEHAALEAAAHGDDWPPEAQQAVRERIEAVAELPQFLALNRLRFNADAKALLYGALFPEFEAASRLLIRRCGRDYSEDVYAKSLPVAKAIDNGDTPWQLFEKWVEAIQPAPSTVESWRYVFKALVEHFKDRSAASITPEEAQAWIDSRITPQRHADTVSRKDLKAVKTVFGLALKRKRIDRNPFADVTVTVPRKQLTRSSKAFHRDEGRLILSAAIRVSDTARPIEAAKRWVPWLLAYTGARPGEITQLRAEDVIEIDGVMALNLTPEAGSIKNAVARIVPLHPHLIEQGFAEFARGRKGPLFFNPDKDKSAKGLMERKKPRAAQTRQRLADWVRKEVKVSGKGLSPLHAWRHTFTQMALRSEMPENLCNYICGHAPASVGRMYAKPTIEDMAKAIAQFPRYEIDEDADDHNG